MKKITLRVTKDHQSIKQEIALLNQRIVVLNLLDTLFTHDPPFFDDEKNVLVEPYKSFLRKNAAVLDDDRFFDRLDKLIKENNSRSTLQRLKADVAKQKEPRAHK